MIVLSQWFEGWQEGNACNLYDIQEGPIARMLESYERQGYTVNKVALAFYPLGGRLDGLYTIVEPYNRQLALDAIERIELTQALVWQLDPENTVGAWDLIPATPNYGCIYCPWYLPGSTNSAIGCKGAGDAD